MAVKRVDVRAAKMHFLCQYSVVRVVTIIERFRQRNPEHDIAIREDMSVVYGYDANDRRTETGHKWQCSLIVDGHKVAILYGSAELERINAESNSGRGVYEGILVHANRFLTQYGIQLK